VESSAKTDARPTRSLDQLDGLICMRPAVIANVIDSAESPEANSWTLCKPNGAKGFFNGGPNSVSRSPGPIADKLNRHVDSRSLAEPGPMSNS
jgi:hypothetical protein